MGESLIAGTPFIVSENDYDWLGPGVYFWEANPRRGLEFAQELQRWRKGKANEIKESFVVGAVIEMGLCLDLTTSTGIQAVAATHQDFLNFCSEVNADVPVNTGGRDLVFRKLDCAVIGHLHKIRQAEGLQGCECANQATGGSTISDRSDRRRTPLRAERAGRDDAGPAG